MVLLACQARGIAIVIKLYVSFVKFVKSQICDKYPFIQKVQIAY